VFNQGLFSEDDTFLLSDWVAHTPREVLSKNFGLAEGALSGLPSGSLYIFPADLPRSLEEDKAAVGGPKVQYTFKMEAMAPTKRTSGGEYASSTRIVFLRQKILPPL
jgi:oxalate decarboxylase